VYYRVSGQGPHKTVCLHGFGEFSRTFDPLSAGLPGHTLVAIDLPWHGETDWREGMDMQVHELLEIIRSIPEIGDSRFGLVGYSMGGRICLALLQAAPVKIEFLLLIAPDGLRENGWYRLATQVPAGNRLFRHTMENPGWFLGLLNAGKKAGLVNESIMKFVHIYVDDKSMRDRIYKAWTTLRRFRPHLPQIKKEIRRNRIPVFLLFGRYDRIILAEHGEKFIHGLEGYARMEVLDVGHQVLHPRNLDAIARALAFCTQEPIAQTP
jgi:pimeloyl-ACP methyl ester carboxylesterase